MLRLEANAVTMRRLRDALAAALAACPARETEARLLCLADAYLAFAAEHHRAWAAIFERRTVAAPDSVQADIAALFGILEGVLRDGGRLAEAAIPVMARALWSSVHGMTYLADLGSLGPLGHGRCAADDRRPGARGGPGLRAGLAVRIRPLARAASRPDPPSNPVDADHSRDAVRRTRDAGAPDA